MEMPKIYFTPKIYFAGKVSHGGGYRGKLLKDDRVMSMPEKEYRINGRAIIYNGPFAIGCDHGCYHRDGSHGLSWNSLNPERYVCQGGQMNGRDYPKGIPPFAVAKSCANQIRACDIFYAYIEATDCYGTIAEIAIASENKKIIYVEIHEDIAEEAKQLWFACCLPGVKVSIVSKPTLDFLSVEKEKEITNNV